MTSLANMRVCLYDEINRVLIAGVQDLTRYGNNVANVLKLMSPVAIGQILGEFELIADLTFTEFAEEARREYPHSALLSLLSGPLHDDVHVKVRLELLSLAKGFVYPFLDMEASASNFMEDCRKPAGVNPKVPMEVRNMYVKIVCRNHFLRSKSWPPLTMTAQVPEVIRNAVRSSTWPEEGASGWGSELFQGIQLGHVYDFNMHLELTDLLSDKSICPGLSNLASSFDSKAHYARTGRPLPPHDKTRGKVLREYLCRDRETVAEVVEMVERDVVPKEFLVFEAVFKERELKIKKARAFCKLTYPLRLYQTSTEKNLSTDIFPLFKGQSMTMTEKELADRVSKFNLAFATARPKHVLICIDFTRWCLSMSWPALHPMLREIDHQYGYERLFQYSHLLPTLVQLLIQDRYRTIPFEGEFLMETTFSTRFQTRWMEGMRQKAWTLFTICLLQRVSEKIGALTTMLGQGDNQIVLVRIPPAERLAAMELSIGGYISSLIKALHEESAEVGLTIKKEETWASTVLFEYGKTFYFRGVECSHGMRHAIRVGS